MDPVPLAQALIRCRSVTPADDGALALVRDALQDLGFSCRMLRFGDGEEAVANLFATRGAGAPHFLFAGHTDVVPEGEGWTADPYAGEVRDGILFGRGAADMKSGVAAMVAAAAAHVARAAPGTLSFIVTGDEEGPAIHGTKAVVRWMREQGLKPDCCLVGEPTSVARLGDMMKIGRRGSLNATITVHGVQGHVAYPDRALNPIDRLLDILGELRDRVLDHGTKWFQPSNLEITDLFVGNKATNVIPGSARARLNIRFNDSHRGEELARWIRRVVADHASKADVAVAISGEAFLTEPGAFSDQVARAVEEESGLRPEPSTSGGTSDARFIRALCPVVEFGLSGATMHKADEAVPVEDIRALARIYERLLRRIFGG